MGNRSTKEHLETIWCHVESSDLENSLNEIFNSFDKDKSGFVPETLDINKDGKITHDEYNKKICSVLHKH